MCFAHRGLLHYKAFPQQVNRPSAADGLTASLPAGSRLRQNGRTLSKMLLQRIMKKWAIQQLRIFFS
jgi:hypothetical protein